MNDELYRDIVAANKDRMYRICCCYVRDDDARKDVYQEILINIWQNLPRFEGRSEISTWVYRISVNTCLGFLRSERRRKKIFEQDPLIAEERLTNATAEAEVPHTDEHVERLYACIDRLPLLDKALISLYLEDLSTEEMADILGMSASNVRVKVHRIKKTIRQQWERTNHGLG